MISMIHAQVIEGKIKDLNSRQPLESVTVFLMPGNLYAATDRAGHFVFRPVQNVTSLKCSAIGYESKTVSFRDFQNNQHLISLSPASLELSAVTISPRAGEQFQTISKIDMSLRDISNSQEVLRIVPGLIYRTTSGRWKSRTDISAWIRL